MPHAPRRGTLMTTRTLCRLDEKVTVGLLKHAAQLLRRLEHPAAG